MDRYPALLIGTKNEIEYQEIPPLKVSSIGTKNRPGKMPNGSALLTDTGKKSKLKKNGINWIIHAVPQERSSSSNDEEFIKIAVKACQNSIVLADREGIKKLAICFIAGKIYRGNCPPEKAAEAIIIGGLNQIESCENVEEIIFVAYDNEKNYYEPYLIDALEKIEKAYYSKRFCRAKVVRGDICHKNVHESEAIVNSENAEMEWGGGISRAIRDNLQEEAIVIDQQRKDLMEKFNDLINGIKSDYFWINNNEKPEWYSEEPFVSDYCLFSRLSASEKRTDIIFKSISVNKNHDQAYKLFKNQDKIITGRQGRYLIKFKEKKQKYEIDDWLIIVNKINKSNIVKKPENSVFKRIAIAILILILFYSLFFFFFKQIKIIKKRKIY